MHRTHPSALCLAAMVSLGLALGTGCSSSSKPAPDTNKNLTTLSPTLGQLSPTFNPAVQNYTLNLYNAPPSISFMVAAASTAKISVGGADTVNGGTSPEISLTPGTPTDIALTVTAENQNKQTYTVKVMAFPANADAWVLDSTNGSPVANTTLSVTDAVGALLQSGIPVDAKGHTSLGLPSSAKYTLIANAPKAAEASLGNFDPAKENLAKLYCHPLGMTNYPASAPQITQMSYSADGKTWTPIAGNVISDAMGKIKQLKVTSIAKSGINATWTAGFGIGIAVDSPAWSIFGDPFYTEPLSMDEVAKPVTINGASYFQTTANFPVNFTNVKSGDKHYIDVVVYDVANNRTEQKVYLTPTDTTSVGTDKDLSTYTPSGFAVQPMTYGQSLEYFGLNGGVSYNASLFFSVLGSTPTDAPNIRGFEIWRSTDGTNFSLIATRQFSAPANSNNGTLGGYYWRDSDPTVDLATTYTYKVRAFGGNASTATSNFTNFSPAVSAKFLAPWTLTLSAPSHNAISTTRAPKFSFVNSNPALFNAAVSSQFRFYLFIKDKMGTGLYGQAYRYNWLATSGGTPAPRWEKLSGGVYVDASAEVSISSDLTTITITPPAALKTVLIPGQSYEWSIFGTSNTTSAAFLKGFTAPTGSSATALSYGSTSDQGNTATNGYFTLIIDPTAN